MLTAPEVASKDQRLAYQTERESPTGEGPAIVEILTEFRFSYQRVRVPAADGGEQP